ncbi:MAG TPA: SAM-dependent methyltransferase [Actinocrinis sp.]|nr:SAM-dependent methyltransferase [Actinocrinis sp.]
MNVPATYFQTMYQHSEDPWSLATRWYDQRKYDLTVAALPKARYRNAFEPGCSVGELSVRLAARCDRLLSCDREARAVTAAASRLSGADHVRVEQRIIPEQWPHEAFDLIVLSEILYYFDAPTVNRILDSALATLAPGGTLAAVHWRHPVADHAQTGDEVHHALRVIPQLIPVCQHTETDFMLEVFVLTNPDQPANPRQGSVAAAEGLA